MTKEYQKLFNEMEQCFHMEKPMMYLIEEINQDNEVVYAWHESTLSTLTIQKAVLEKHTIKITHWELNNPNDYLGLISDLSSGNAKTYYASPQEWYDKLTQVLSSFTIDEYPDIYNKAGHHVLQIKHTSYYVFFTWYEMQSGRWEIICYLTRG